MVGTCLGPYGGARGGGRSLMSEVPLSTRTTFISHNVSGSCFRISGFGHLREPKTSPPPPVNGANRSQNPTGLDYGGGMSEVPLYRGEKKRYLGQREEILDEDKERSEAVIPSKLI